jgi:hypothetical protein
VVCSCNDNVVVHDDRSVGQWRLQTTSTIPSIYVRVDLDTIKDAAQADRVEHKQTIREAFHVHKKAIFWSGRHL